MVLSNIATMSINQKVMIDFKMSLIFTLPKHACHMQRFFKAVKIIKYTCRFKKMSFSIFAQYKDCGYVLEPPH